MEGFYTIVAIGRSPVIRDHSSSVTVNLMLNNVAQISNGKGSCSRIFAINSMV
jgi:hypothetical protein